MVRIPPTDCGCVVQSSTEESSGELNGHLEVAGKKGEGEEDNRVHMD